MTYGEIGPAAKTGNGGHARTTLVRSGTSTDSHGLGLDYTTGTRRRAFFQSSSYKKLLPSPLSALYILSASIKCPSPRKEISLPSPFYDSPNTLPCQNIDPDVYSYDGSPCTRITHIPRRVSIKHPTYFFFFFFLIYSREYATRNLENWQFDNITITRVLLAKPWLLG